MLNKKCNCKTAQFWFVKIVALGTSQSNLENQTRYLTIKVFFFLFANKSVMTVLQVAGGGSPF